MLYLFFSIQIVYTIFCVYFFVYKSLREDITTTMKVVTLFSYFAILSVFYALPYIFSSMYYSEFASMFINLLFLSLFVLIKVILKSLNAYLQNFKFKNISNAIVLFYLVIYTPIIVLYINRTKSESTFIINSIVTLGLIYLIFYLISYIKKTKYNNIFITIQVVSFVLGYIIISIVFVKGLDPVNGFMIYNNDDDQEVSRNLFSDYYSLNTISVFDGDINSYVIDFYFNDNYLYYVTYMRNGNVYIKIYDILEDDIILERKLINPEEFGEDIPRDRYADRKELFFKIEETIYFFDTDGIYTIEGTDFTKVFDINNLNTSTFIENDDQLYVLSEQVDFLYKIYVLDVDGLQLVDTLDDSETIRAFISSDKLIISNSEINTIEIYGGSTYQIPESLRNYDLILATDNNLVFKAEWPDIFRIQLFYVLNIDGSISTTKYDGSHVDNTGVYNDKYYSLNYYLGVNGNNFIDEELNIIQSFNPVMFDSKYNYLTSIEIIRFKVFDDNLYYSIYYYGSSTLYFEINQLVEHDIALDLTIFEYVNGAFVFAVGFMLLFPKVNGKNRITEVTNKDDDENEEILY
ncbi:MAG: hypothetical protein QM489_05225 [Candidatus Izemoplasma sp.]